MQHIKRLFDIHPWKIATTSISHEDHRLQESLTSIGNGYMGMRGNYEEGYSGDTHQGTYIAGVWFPDKTRVGWWKNGYPEYFGKVINAVNFIAVDIEINGEKVDLAKMEPKDFYLELDMQTGVLTRRYTVEINGVLSTLEFTRFLSLATKELSVQKINVKTDKPANIKLTSKLDGNVHNLDANYDEQFWIEKSVGNTPFPYITSETLPNNFGVEQFSVTAMAKTTTSPEVNSITSTEKLACKEVFVFENETEVTLFKNTVIITSRDVAEENHVAAAEEILLPSVEKGFEALLAEQIDEWAKRWEMADVTISGDDSAQQGIRFNLFQLFATYYGEDERLNIGPKGFTGEKYGGATYWDTEAYAVPLYLALTDTSVTRNLLKYRHNQLPQAQHNARQQGLKGALYPMVTFTGVECHNEWEITFEEIHRNGAIPYAIYNYTNYTGDTSYVENEGLEVLVEVARFWACRVHFSKRAGKYMIHGVTGPNEYENNINNNWYTNTIASWVLRYTSEMLEKFPREDLGVTADEVKKWQDIVDNMYYPKDEELGVFVQHDTFLDKDLMSVSQLDPSNLPLNQNWSWDKILRSCFIKQADVLQGIYFFGNEYTIEEKKKNFDFYEPMTVHESSLSPSIHAILAAELGMEEKAVEMYERTARLDLDNYNNDTDDGLHITSMTGSWLAIVQGFAQMKTWNETLSFAPFKPKTWNSYAFHINYRGRLLAIEVTDKVTVTLKQGAALEIELYGEKVLVENSFCVKTK
ncbi:maltose phosphorylase [Pilibacter termitis]|uniref:Maltose phosphorylase n=1 Tax=Pilibacter termitis TaxID=263852 RepID=A0A1T4QJW2_9ENTE|nr:glycoside hydrolase family 65 protein [Pilibacter termitis]SKA04083.1 maltose phosphorylase [Pilibacter termitis]